MKHRVEECYNNTKVSQTNFREIRELIVSFLGKNKREEKAIYTEKSIKVKMKYCKVVLTGVMWIWKWKESVKREGQYFKRFWSNFQMWFLKYQATHSGKFIKPPEVQNAKNTTCSHIRVKTSETKEKEKILKTARGKGYITFKGETIRLTVPFCNRKMEIRGQHNDIINAKCIIFNVEFYTQWK